MNLGTVREVMDIIANGYGSVPSGLDRAIASRVVAYFEDKGWVSPEDIAYLVQAAGGEIRVTESALLTEAPLLQWQRDPESNDMVVRSIDKDKLIRNAKVNPEAEARVVDSGPIAINLESTLQPKC